MRFGATPSQTVGPFFTIGLTRLCRDNLTTSDMPGERITIQGRVLDANGEPVSDALIETWQADVTGRYCGLEEIARKTSYDGFGRIPTDEEGVFRFTTIKPGRVRDFNGTKHAPHISVAVFMRGLLRHLVTRIYFAGDRDNDNDPVLTQVPTERRHTLLAKPTSTGGSLLEWNVILQGERETVFFDW